MNRVGIILCVSGILLEFAAQFILPEGLDRIGHLASIFVIVVGVAVLVIDERAPAETLGVELAVSLPKLRAVRMRCRCSLVKLIIRFADCVKLIACSGR